MCSFWINKGRREGRKEGKKEGRVWGEGGKIMLVFRAANSLILEYLRNRRGLIWPGTLFHFIGRNKSSPGRGGPVIKTPLQPFNLAGERSKMNLIEHPISLDITYFFLFVLCESREETYKYTCPGKSFPFKKPNRLRLHNECRAINNSQNLSHRRLYFIPPPLPSPLFLVLPFKFKTSLII